MLYFTDSEIIFIFFDFIVFIFRFSSFYFSLFFIYIFLFIFFHVWISDNIYSCGHKFFFFKLIKKKCTWDYRDNNASNYALRYIQSDTAQITCSFPVHASISGSILVRIQIPIPVPLQIPFVFFTKPYKLDSSYITCASFIQSSIINH